MSITETDRLRAQVAVLSAQIEQMQRPRSGEEAAAMQQAQARCDAALAPFGERASEPTQADSLTTYRRRLFASLAKHSPSFSASRFDSAPAEVLDAIEPKLFAEAREMVRHDAARKPGILIPVTERDESGRMITRFEGDPMAWMQAFTMPGAHGRFTNPSGDR